MQSESESASESETERASADAEALVGVRIKDHPPSAAPALPCPDLAHNKGAELATGRRRRRGETAVAVAVEEEAEAGEAGSSMSARLGSAGQLEESKQRRPLTSRRLHV